VSPPWLIAQGRPDDAQLVLAHVNARGDMRDPVVVSEFHMIMDHLSHEKAVAERKMSVRDLVSTPVARRRLLIGPSPGLFSCIAGNIIASYYLSSELKAAISTTTRATLMLPTLLENNRRLSHPLYFSWNRHGTVLSRLSCRGCHRGLARAY
jgi:hypothetical protein